MKKNIIIDCDPGHDDVMALLVALAHRDKLNILGVTTVAGNQTLDRVTNNLCKIYTYLGLSTPVASGAAKPLMRELVSAGEVHGRTGLDGFQFPEPTFKIDSTNAITFMRDKIMNADGKVILVPTAPLTNIALLISTFPEVKEQISEISLMGGSIYAGNTTAHGEFNIYVDPEAAKIVFDSGIPITMSCLEVTHKAFITDKEIEYLKSQEGKVSKMAGNLLYFYTRYHNSQGYTSYPLHDVCSVIYLLRPEIFKYKNMHIDIDTSHGPYRGKTVTDNREWAKHENPNSKVLLDIDREEFVSILLNSLEKLDEICK